VTEWLSFTVVGLVTGCVYALIATGLVVTYTTTGIFNFAHGAIGMIAAFTFWQLWQAWHINAVVSLVLVLFVIAPLFGLIVEALLMRPLYGASVDMTVVVTLGLLLASSAQRSSCGSRQRTSCRRSSTVTASGSGRCWSPTTR